MGRVVLLPIRFASNADFATDVGAEGAVAKVMTLLGTQPGDIDWRPEFGCDLRAFRHKNMTPSMEAVAKTRIQDSFDRWLPSLLLKSAIFRRENRTMKISIFFNQRTGSAAPRFPNDLQAEIQIDLGG